jgi:DNA polymerase III epsilon subunit-like protein
LFSTFLLTLEALHAALEVEQTAERVNSLESLYERTGKRQQLMLLWQAIDMEVREMKGATANLPTLPPIEHVKWAQTVSAMRDLVFLEIDTTGLRQEDELIRFTTVNGEGELLDDWLIQPLERTLRSEASAANGIAPEHLQHAQPVAEVWPKIQRALSGRYVLSFSQEWDREILQRTAARHHLEPLVFVGECLQRRATQYYHREYSLTLENLCVRVGAPLPGKPHQTSIDRARGQIALLQAFAQAKTSVQLAQPTQMGRASAQTSEAGDDFDPFLDGDMP